MSLGMPELILILVIVLLLFGGSKLPDLSRNMGKSLREMRESFDSASKTAEKPKSEETKKDENQS